MTTVRTRRVTRVPTRLVLLAAAAAATSALAPQTFAATLSWDSSGANPTAPVDGSGTWNTTDAKWSNGASDVVWDNASTAGFGSNNGAAGIVTIDDAALTVTAAGLTFAPPGSGSYTIAAAAGNSLTLSGANPVISVGTGVNATISAPIGGAFGNAVSAAGAGLVIKGTGSLTLQSSANTYTGDTTIQYGGTGGTGVNVTLANGASLGNVAGNIYVGYANVNSATDTSTLNTTAGGSATVTANQLFVSYVYNFTTVSGTTGSAVNFNGNDTLNVNNIRLAAGRNNSATKGGHGTLRLGSGATLTLNGIGRRGQQRAVARHRQLQLRDGRRHDRGHRRPCRFRARHRQRNHRDRQHRHRQGRQRQRRGVDRHDELF